MADKNKDQRKGAEKKRRAETNAQGKASAAGREEMGEARQAKAKKADRIADPNAAKGSASDGDTAR